MNEEYKLLRPSRIPSCLARVEIIGANYLTIVQLPIRVVLVVVVAVSRIAQDLQLCRIGRAVVIASGKPSLITERYILVIFLPIKHELVASLEEVLNFVAAEAGRWGGRVLDWCCLGDCCHKGGDQNSAEIHV